MSSARMVSNAETAAKIKKYENFVETKLKVDLRAILDARDKLYTQISDYVTLRNNIKTVQDSKQKKLKTMVNLGSEFWVQAVVPDTSTIMVNIGLGFHAELSLDEAVKFTHAKEKLMNVKADRLTKEAAKVSSHIKMVLTTIGELAQLSQIDTNKKPRRPQW